MKTPDQIIIEELKRIVLMQSQEITRLITKINIIERELSGYTTKKDSNNSSMPPSKEENKPPRTSSLREKWNRKAGEQPEHGKIVELLILLLLTTEAQLRSMKI
jgi:transposase